MSTVFGCQLLWHACIEVGNSAEQKERIIFFELFVSLNLEGPSILIVRHRIWNLVLEPPRTSSGGSVVFQLQSCGADEQRRQLIRIGTAEKDPFFSFRFTWCRFMSFILFTQWRVNFQVIFFGLVAVGDGWFWPGLFCNTFSTSFRSLCSQKNCRWSIELNQTIIFEEKENDRGGKLCIASCHVWTSSVQLRQHDVCWTSESVRNARESARKNGNLRETAGISGRALRVSTRCGFCLVVHPTRKVLNFFSAVETEGTYQRLVGRNGQPQNHHEGSRGVPHTASVHPSDSWVPKIWPGKPDNFWLNICLAICVYLKVSSASGVVSLLLGVFNCKMVFF